MTTGATKVVRRESRRCYRLALQANHGLEGTVVYEAVVTSNGRVAGVEQISTTASSERLDGCLAGIIYALRFDTSSGKAALVRRLYVRLELSREIFNPQVPPIKEENLEN